jgi:hypothetical protein
VPGSEVKTAQGGRDRQPLGAGVLGEQARGGTTVELVATPEGRTGIGGTIAQ